MATVAELMVKIDANNKGLNSALKQSKSRVAAFAKSVKKALVKAFKVGLAAAAVSIAGITAALIKASIHVDKLAKTSIKLGIATEELQKLHLQAKLSGVRIETLNMALQRMVRRISEAAMGSGEAIAALKELGLSAEDLNRLSPDKQFTAVANAMKQVTNQADRVRLSMRLFDSEGVALVNTLGSDLKGVSREFDALGLGISKSQAAAVEAFNDSRTKLGAIFEDISGKVLAELSPAFQSLTNDVIEWVKSMGGANVIAAKVKDGIVASWTAIGNSISFAGIFIDNFSNAMDSAKESLTQFLVDNMPRINALIDRIKSLVGWVKELSSNLMQANRPVTQAVLDQFPSLQYDPNSVNHPSSGLIGNSKPDQKIQIEILPDQKGLVTAVVRSPEYNNSVIEITQNTMKNTARSVGR